MAVKLIEMLTGGQLGIEDPLGGELFSVLLPEFDKAQDLTRLLGLRDPGVGVAGDPFGGVAGEEDQDALLAAAGDVVLLQGFFLGIGGDGMKIQVDGGAGFKPATLRLLNQAAIIGAVVEAGAIGGQIGAVWERRSVRRTGRCPRQRRGP